VPYRDELESLKAHIEALTAERDDALARLERTRAALASVVGDLAGLPAEADIPWRSVHGGEPLTVRFVNASDRKLELRWVSYDGRDRPETTLVPGGEREQHTYVAHLWRLLDPNGKVVLQHYVRAGDTRIVSPETSA
jgi:hypothetical protein